MINEKISIWSKRRCNQMHIKENYKMGNQKEEKVMSNGEREYQKT